MFNVHISSEAKAYIAEQSAIKGLSRPGLMMGRQGAVGEVIRTSEGQTKWTIERPHPWRAQIIEIGEHNVNVIDVNGISIWFALIPKQWELGVQVSIRDGDLFVEPLAV